MKLYLTLFNIILLSLLSAESARNLKPEMVKIPEGSFIMGNDFKDAYYDERFEHKVNLDSFMISSTEITNAQYTLVLNKALASGQIYLQDNKYVINSYGDFQELIAIYDRDSRICYSDSLKQFYTETGFENIPVCEITWYGAAFYCNILSEMFSLDPVYDLTNWSWIPGRSGFRLPTEAEWEYSYYFNEEKKFLSKEEADSLAVYRENSDYDLQQVKSKGKSNAGLYDMAGNVSEWCYDFYKDDYYQASPEKNPKGLEKGEIKVVRGGNWYLMLEDLQGFRRDGHYPGMTLEGLGFRIARSFPKTVSLSEVSK